MAQTTDIIERLYLNIETSIAIRELGHVLDQNPTGAQVAFGIYKLLTEAGIVDDEIENIGIILEDIAVGD